MNRQISSQNTVGRGARLMARERRVTMLWLAVVGLLCLAIFFCLNLTNIWGFKPLVTLICILGMIAVDRGIIPLMDRFKKREGDAIRGAEAEEAVGAILDRLPDNHMVLHDVECAYGNIDHLILRKDGAVFMIETKSMHGQVSERNGQLLVNGKPPQKDFIRQAQRNAAWVSDVLQTQLGIIPWVSGAVVFTKAYVSVRRKLGQIDVVNVGYLQRWMARAPGQREVVRRATAQWEKIRSALEKRSLPAPQANTCPVTAT